VIEPEHEGRRPPRGEGFSDAVTFSFADPEHRLYGLARIGLSPPPGRASALALLFAGERPVAVRAQGDADTPESEWEQVTIAGVTTAVAEPLARWRTSFEGDGAGFALDFTAACPPFAPGAGSALEGYEQLCRVEGYVSVGGRRTAIACLGQRSHLWGPSPWERIEIARSVCAWVEGPGALSLSAQRAAGADSHASEQVSAVLVDATSDSPGPVAVDEPRLSTTYDAEGHHRRAGLELWVGEDDELPRRASGEVVCGTSLALGRLRLDCAFMHWHLDGRAGAGRYDVLRRA
jgi:hypothetical protein